MKNWKTTLAGALAGGVVAIAPLVQSGHIDVLQTVVGFLIAFLGFFAKDHDVTGTGA
ncbi:MAG: hypothetical protein M0Z52_03780 [Actinomycetota bacterium]|nr:hypothetical protein [Actinomycetota bacterium]